MFTLKEFEGAIYWTSIALSYVDAGSVDETRNAIRSLYSIIEHTKIQSRIDGRKHIEVIVESLDKQDIQACKEQIEELQNKLLREQSIYLEELNNTI